MTDTIDYFYWPDIVAGVPELCEEITQHCTWLETGIGEDARSDVRYKMLGGMRDDYASSLWIIGGSVIITKSKDRIDEFFKLVDQAGDKKKIDLTFTRYLRRTLVTRIYFLADHLLGLLSKSLDGNRKYKVHENVNKIIKFKNLASVLADSYSAMGFTRNSFHNNCRHSSNDSYSYTIDGHDFNFSKGVEVALAWKDVRTLVHQVMKDSLVISLAFGNNAAIQDV